MYSLCCIHLISESVCTSGTTKTLKVRYRTGLILGEHVAVVYRCNQSLILGLIIGLI